MKQSCLIPVYSLLTLATLSTVGCSSSGKSASTGHLDATLSGTMGDKPIHFEGRLSPVKVHGLLRPGFYMLMATNGLRKDVQPQVFISLMLQGGSPGPRSIITTTTPALPKNEQVAQFALTVDKVQWTAEGGQLAVKSIVVADDGITQIDFDFCRYSSNRKPDPADDGVHFGPIDCATAR